MTVSPASTPEWPEKDVAVLTKLWAEGLTASQIAIKMRGRTRSAVIGKVHRLKLDPRREASAPKPKPLKLRAPIAPQISRAHHTDSIGSPMAQPSPPKPARFGVLSQSKSTATPEMRQKFSSAGQKAIERIDASPVESPNATPFLEARRGCKWPIGDGLAMRYCCNPISRRTYCEGHAAIAFASMPQRRDYSASKSANALTRFDRVRSAKPPAAANDGPFDDVRAA